jgi:15-cis-phytoene synthase
VDLYSKVSQKMSRSLTLDYSTSFGSATRLFPRFMQADIFNIYGMVRIADEVVDTYMGDNKLQILNDLEQEVFESIKRQYSPNPILHSFALTANKFNIDHESIKSFFKSMRRDITPVKFDKKSFNDYIHGSAEVIGDMTLSVFTQGNKQEYNSLLLGARKLGSAYQKVNFLRDYAEDTARLGRYYFPDVKSLTETAKKHIIDDIKEDFNYALPHINQIPNGADKAVKVSYIYYSKLLEKLERTPAEQILSSRVRLPDYQKAQIFALAKMKLV